jgi:hypothetical protein
MFSMGSGDAEAGVTEVKDKIETTGTVSEAIIKVDSNTLPKCSVLTYSLLFYFFEVSTSSKNFGGKLI